MKDFGDLVSFSLGRKKYFTGNTSAGTKGGIGYDQRCNNKVLIALHLSRPYCLSGFGKQKN